VDGVDRRFGVQFGNLRDQLGVPDTARVPSNDLAGDLLYFVFAYFRQEDRSRDERNRLFPD
jgi:hypothetical protein